MFLLLMVSARYVILILKQAFAVIRWLPEAKIDCPDWKSIWLVAKAYKANEFDYPA